MPKYDSYIVPKPCLDFDCHLKQKVGEAGFDSVEPLGWKWMDAFFFELVFNCKRGKNFSQMNEQMIEWGNHLINKWTNEWMNVWMNEWVN